LRKGEREKGKGNHLLLLLTITAYERTEKEQKLPDTLMLRKLIPFREEGARESVLNRSDAELCRRKRRQEGVGDSAEPTLF